MYAKGAYLKDPTVYMCVYILCMCGGGKTWNLWAIIKMACMIYVHCDFWYNLVMHAKRP